MNNRVDLLVTMELLSDTIFGSGYSIPGGEDIAVCQDEKGYPYLKGSTFKGLLRESLENYLVWTGRDSSDANALLGESGWAAAKEDRKLHITELRLIEPPDEPKNCYSTRSFTALEGDVVKSGSLRVASCIRSGLRFGGTVECVEEDADLVKHALAGIKGVGTLRSRGFGQVRVAAEEDQTDRTAVRIHKARCIRYRLLTQTPVLITDLGRSRGNSMDSRDYISGSAVRGMVASALAESSPEAFEAIRADLLSSRTRFLDAVPIRGTLPPLPSLQGFYEDKAETVFQSILKDGKTAPGLKRAKHGSFCAPDGDTLCCWSAVTGGATRIALKKENGTEMFQTRYLEPGQVLEGYILLDQPALAEQICKVLRGTVWLGADRYSGFGKCDVIEIESMERPAWIDAYGYQVQEEIGTQLYLLAVSPFTMLDESGSPCGLDEDKLAEALGVGAVEVVLCSTAVREFGGYNRIWKSRTPAVQMYDRGSLFHLRCNQAPTLERLSHLQSEGIGVRRSEGFGEVLFLRPEVIGKLEHKKTLNNMRSEANSPVAETRRIKCEWVMAHANMLTTSKLSKSQVGTFQTLCEKALRKQGDLTELRIWLTKNTTERGAAHGNCFQAFDAFVSDVLSPERDQATGVPHMFSVTERLELLCMLCNYSRKIREGESKG